VNLGGAAGTLRAFGPRWIARRQASRHLRVSVEGGEHLPAGAVLLACRHFHHLYDGAALLDALPRRLHIMVALDWAKDTWTRRGMEFACALAGWPTVLRSDNLSAASAYEQRDAYRYVRRGLDTAARLLRRGEGLIVFPEAYPTIDPDGARKAGDEFLPFRRGLLTIVALAQRGGAAPVPIVPVGLAYRRTGEGWDVILRLDPPRFLTAGSDRTALLADLSARVRALSA
jgi:putative membrane protein